MIWIARSFAPKTGNDWPPVHQDFLYPYFMYIFIVKCSNWLFFFLASKMTRVRKITKHKIVMLPFNDKICMPIHYTTEPATVGTWINSSFFLTRNGKNKGRCKTFHFYGWGWDKFWKGGGEDKRILSPLLKERLH